jgi:hypothetical protein
MLPAFFHVVDELRVARRPSIAACVRTDAHPHDSRARKIFFSIFIDRMFTLFVAALFTKLFDWGNCCNLAACLSHACNAG